MNRSHARAAIALFLGFLLSACGSEPLPAPSVDCSAHAEPLENDSWTINCNNDSYNDIEELGDDCVDGQEVVAAGPWIRDADGVAGFTEIRIDPDGQGWHFMFQAEPGETIEKIAVRVRPSHASWTQPTSPAAISVGKGLGFDWISLGEAVDDPASPIYSGAHTIEIQLNAEKFDPAVIYMVRFQAPVAGTVTAGLYLEGPPILTMGCK